LKRGGKKLHRVTLSEETFIKTRVEDSGRGVIMSRRRSAKGSSPELWEREEKGFNRSEDRESLSATGERGSGIPSSVKIFKQSSSTNEKEKKAILKRFSSLRFRKICTADR